MIAPGRPVRLGVIGAGAIAQAHAAAFRSAPDDLRLVAVSDPDQSAARALADACPGDQRVSNQYEAWIGTGEVDAVLIAAPHDLHFAIASDCVRAGLHVLAEKPLATDLAQLRILHGLAAKHRVEVAAAQVRRFHPTTLAARRWTRSSRGAFGSLVSFDLHACQSIEAYLANNGADANHWILDGTRAGGGVLISVAIHYIDLLRFLTGEDFASVHAIALHDAPMRAGAESALCATFRMSGGAIGCLHSSFSARRLPYNDRLNLYGTRGSLVQHLHPLGYHRGTFLVSTAETPASSWASQYEGFHDVDPVPAEMACDDPFVNQLLSFVRSVASGTRAENDVAENFNTLACVSAAYRSPASGLPETVEHLRRG